MAGAIPASGISQKGEQTIHRKEVKMMKLVSEYGLREKTCPICGKKFYCYAEMYVYVRKAWKKTSKYFCSWSCLRKYDEFKDAHRKTGKRKLSSAYGECVR